MMKLNEFRLNQESAFLFVLSYEYDIAFAKLLSIYNISAKLFWATLSLLNPMSKMGVRKASQLAKTASRLYKNIYDIKDKKKERVEYQCFDEDGEPIYNEDGTPKMDKRTRIEYIPIVLDEYELKIKNILQTFITNGYSNGQTFYNDNDIMDLGIPHTALQDFVKIDGDNYIRTSQIEFIMEKYFPDITTADYRKLSIKAIGDLFKTVEELDKLETVEV